MSAIPPGPGGQAPSPLHDPTKSHLQLPSKGPYSSEPRSQSGSDVSLHRVKNLPGYTTPVFKGKEEQRAKVQENVAAKVRGSLMVESRLAQCFFSFPRVVGVHPP
jgi:hypothetical protein